MHFYIYTLLMHVTQNDEQSNTSTSTLLLRLGEWKSWDLPGRAGNMMRGPRITGF